MPVTVESSGTQAATVGTEHSLAVLTGPKSFMLVIDLGNMVNGDEVELRAKAKVLSGGTRKQMDFAVFQHAQPEPVAIFGPFPGGHDCEFSLKQTAGASGRSFDWGAWSV